jgi:hypothetical protein
MILSTTTPEFWKCYRGAPDEVQRAAQKAYRLWRENPQHPSLLSNPWKISGACVSHVHGVPWGGITMGIWFGFGWEATRRMNGS